MPRFRGARRASGLAPWSVVASALLGACSGTADAGRQGSPPATAAVRDGPDADLDEQTSRTSLFANWDRFVAPDGGPVVYEWCLGTDPGADDVIGWSMVGGATRAAISGIELPLGIALYVGVRASDLRGNRSAVATSDGIVIGGRRERPTRTGQPPTDVPAGHAAALERHGITWRFAQPAPCGRFANGDWWVLGPVDVVAIRPQSLVDGERVRHGAMIDPSPRALVQGYDSAMFGDGAVGRFDRNSDVALGVDERHPLRLAAGTSLVATVSRPQPGELPQLESCAVLTCLAEPPPAGAFRPPYCGADKRCRWTVDALDLGRLARLEPVVGAPAIGELVERFERTWLDHLPGFTGRYLHPRANMPDYGRDIADLVGTGALVLQLDLPADVKRPLAIAMVQIGIDVYGIVHNGGRFAPDGGSGSGRKFPLLLAAALLDDGALFDCARQNAMAFGEDAQTFYVEESSPGIWNHGFGGYGPSDSGLAEWGNRHADDPSLDQKAWNADPYRRCCTANAWPGFVLAARIMGLREAWSHAALFDYVDRYMQIETRGDWMRALSPFAERMWDRYRGEFQQD